jgi:hypothetical protein
MCIKEVGSMSQNSTTRKWNGLFEEAPKIAKHTITLCLTIVSIWVVDLFLKYFLGADAKFFGVVPIKYMIHGGDIFAFLKFIRDMFNDFRGKS